MARSKEFDFSEKNIKIGNTIEKKCGAVTPNLLLFSGLGYILFIFYYNLLYFIIFYYILLYYAIFYYILFIFIIFYLFSAYFN